MPSMLQWPNIPLVADGQVAGATMLQSLTRATNYLAGEYHGGYSAEWCRPRDASTTSYSTKLYFRSQYRKGQAAYWLSVSSVNAGQGYSIEFSYYGDDDAWHVPTGGTVSSSGPQAMLTGTFDLSSEAQMTERRVYRWRMRAKMTNSGQSASLRLWRWVERYATVDGWQGPSVFTATTSSAAEVNLLRGDLNALYQYRCGGAVSLLACEPKLSLTTDMETYQRTAFRYRHDTCKLAIRGNAGWFWQVALTDTAGTREVIWSSGQETTPNGLGNYGWVSQDLTLSALVSSITLTPGAVYRLDVDVKRPDSVYGSVEGLMVSFASDGSNDGSWATPREWQPLDTVLGPTNMNAYVTDLSLLYSGGPMALWGESPMVIETDTGLLIEASMYTGVHRRRFLIYEEDDQPTLTYGPTLQYTYQLPGEAGVHSFDMTSIDILPGTPFCVSGVDYALESDLPHE